MRTVPNDDERLIGLFCHWLRANGDSEQKSPRSSGGFLMRDYAAGKQGLTALYPRLPFADRLPMGATDRRAADPCDGATAGKGRNPETALCQ